MNKEWNDADMRGDVAAMGRLPTDKLTTVNICGAVESKLVGLVPFKSGNVKIDSIIADEYIVRVYWHTAVMTHLGILKGRYKGENISHAYRATHVWVRRDGRWQVVASQSTHIAEK